MLNLFLHLLVFLHGRFGCFSAKAIVHRPRHIAAQTHCSVSLPQCGVRTRYRGVHRGRCWKSGSCFRCGVRDHLYKSCPIRFLLARLYKLLTCTPTPTTDAPIVGAAKVISPGVVHNWSCRVVAGSRIKLARPKTTVKSRQVGISSSHDVTGMSFGIDVAATSNSFSGIRRMESTDWRIAD